MIEKHGNLIQRICGFTYDKKIQNFITKLYEDVPIESLENIPLDHLYKSAENTFSFLKKPRDNSWSIYIRNTNEDEEYAVIEVISKEMTFLVESVSNELKAQGISIFLIVHPVISVLRNNKEEMKEIGKGREKELVMQFHIANQFDKVFYDNLITRLHEIIGCVDLATKDWHKMRQLMKQTVLDIKGDSLKAVEESEIASFLSWLIDNHFIFLGAVEIENKDGKFFGKEGSRLGVTKSPLYYREEFPGDYEPNTSIFLKKCDTRAVVHKNSHMNCIYYKFFEKDGSCDRGIIFTGFFTSNVYYESVRNIPFIREKVNKIIDRYGFAEDSYNTKELITALESFSRSELMQMPEDQLYETATGIVSLSLMPRVKLFIRPDRANEFISCLIYIPSTRFVTDVKDVIERILCQQLNGVVSRRYANVGENQLTRLQFIIKSLDPRKKDFDIRKIEELIISAISAWSDDLLNALKVKHKTHDAMILFNKFQNAFDIKYTSSFAAKQAVHDIKMVEEALAEDFVKFDFYISAKSGKELIQLKIFSPNNELPLSSVLPVIENFGFFVIDTLTFIVEINDSGEEKEVFIHHFRLKPLRGGARGLTTSGKNNVELALENLWKGEIENDKFNSLILQVGINCREAIIFRAYSRYFKQICFPYTKSAIIDALLINAEITEKLILLFNSKFNIQNKFSEESIDQIIYEIEEMLSSVPNVVEDKILRSYLELILATKRTNFFQKNSSGNFKNYTSFKIASGKLNDIPLPKPFMEIFVYSTRFEAVHLRGSKVARGGLRWSDRHEDFRTEILGLMKAQVTKNSVIVPGGSKGGFVVKSATPSIGRDLFLQEGIECYKDFLNGILDITDNVVENKIVYPKDVIRHDGDDTYLVVAADKGTATFSDYANEIAQKHNFWLGDAFASGGSAGYDHKKLAITARGTWVSAEDHLKGFGININNHSFTAVGIGDMSGDVFGNGLLLSRHFRLIAAFNHLHIFLDPTPNTEKSFTERKRLFEMPRSQWSDYNPEAISKGGGIFSRSEKKIALTTEIQKALDITDKSLSPNELISAILKSPVDLLWNGGIGTYVKAKHEAHSSIGDKANDDIRINGRELRCKSVVEAGNLGLTQLGRIEFARKGGKVNADFIDNSAGVDCSDHEVNMKIAFSDLLEKKKIKSVDVRNKLLMEMSDEVCELVLKDNRQQSLLLTLEEHRNKERVDEHAWLIRNLETRGELNREVEMLPSNEEMPRIIAEYGKLSRPEISVLVSYAKNSASQILLQEEKLLEDDYIKNYLINYFPKTMQEKFREELLNHKLKKEISITVLVNSFVNTLGCYLFHYLMDSGGYRPNNIIKSFIIAGEVLGIIDFWNKMEEISNTISADLQLTILLFVQRLLKRNVIWLLTHYPELPDIKYSMEFFKRGIDGISKLKDKKSLLSAQFGCYSKCSEAVSEGKLPKKILDFLQNIVSLNYTFDITKIAEDSKSSIQDAVHIHYLIAKELSIDWILEYAPNITLSSYIESTALQTIIIEIYELHIELAIYKLKNKKNKFDDSDQLSHYRSFVDEIKRSSLTTNFIPTMTVAVKRLKEFVKNTKVATNA